MVYPIVLIFLAPTYAVQITQDIVGNTAFTLSEWISLLLSRGVYFILAFLIAICFIITTIKKKLSEREVKEEEEIEELPVPSLSQRSSYWSEQSDQSDQSQYYIMPENENENAISSESTATDSAEIRLRETMETLKSELEIANKSKTELEITLAMMAKDKTGAEDHLIKMWKDDSETNFRTSEEKEKSCENLNHEESLMEHQILVESLENTRCEIERLKSQSEHMKAERDLAIRLAGELMEKVKGVPHRDTEQRQLIEDMIDTELKKVREEDDDSKHSEIDIKAELERIENYCQISETPPAEPYTKPTFTNECKASECGTKCILHSDIRSLRMAVGDGPLTICNNLNDLFIAVQASDSNDEPRTESLSSDSSVASVDEEGDEEKKNLVTRSPAFMAFLNSWVQRDSSIN